VGPWVTCYTYTHPVCYQLTLIHVLHYGSVWICDKTAQFWT